ncbi:DUF4440 domain-containing protein [Dyella sp.]|uniref:nuclear transport factor 2 family protein n=1 Tax=Dyella sp. TaxID=1869338 RepID=UPI002ED057D8
MRKLLHAWSIVALIASPCWAGDATVPVRDQITALTQRLMDGIGAGDKALWQETLTDDAIVVDEFGRRQGKQELIDSLRAFPAGFSGSIEVRDAQVHEYGDTVVMRFEGYERETVFGQHFIVRYINVMTYVRDHDRWKLAGYEAVTLPTPPPSLEVADLPLDDYRGSYRYAPNRAWVVSVRNGAIGYVTGAGRAFDPLEPVARDVFMSTDDERNLLVFRRDRQGNVVELIERRKFNDLHLRREN